MSISGSTPPTTPQAKRAVRPPTESKITPDDATAELPITTPADIRKFLDSVDATRELWDSVSVRVVAARIRNEWVSISTLCALQLRGRPRSGKRCSVRQTTRILAAQETIPLKRLRE